MSTIEQAAKRLAQLRRSGTEVDQGSSAEETVRDAGRPVVEAVPLRMARELDSGIANQSSAGRAQAVAAAQDAGREAAHAVPLLMSAVSVHIDLARLSAEGYITPQASRSALAEQFRVIKRPVLMNARGKSAAPVFNANRIMVTSSLPSEGKTFVSVNLAMSLAMELDAHVLLVDADTSRPAVLDRLGLPPSRGLLDLLVDPSLSFESVVMSTNIERLSILPAGSPQDHATELLGSEAMGRLVEKLASIDQRLIVLFDTPPLLAASEARVLAAHMGQVVMVVAADDTPQGTFAEALATIENCPVVFTLLNRSTAKEAAHYYGSYNNPYAK